LIRIATLAALAALLTACGDADVRRSAAADVHAFLSAAQSGDRKTFRAYVDRPAVRADLRRQLEAEVRRRGLEARPFDDRAIDRMIEPQYLSLQGAVGFGARSVPPAGQIALLIKVLPDGRACLMSPAIPPECVLTFENQSDRWRLVAVAATDMQIVRAPRV
jgi:hypothetical protein